MKNYRFLTLLVALAVLLPAAALASGHAAAVDEAAVEIEASAGATGQEATTQESHGEEAEAQIEIIPNLMTWTKGLNANALGNCVELCSNCPNANCEFACQAFCDRFFILCNDVVCCNLQSCQ